MTLDPEKLLSLIGLTTPGAVKSNAYDLDTIQSGGGMVVVYFTNVINANQGLPDYFVDVVVSGMTFPDDDPQGAIIRQLHHDALGSVQRWTPESVTNALELPAPAKILGIINISSTFREDANAHLFQITCRLVATELYLEYYERPLPVYQVDDSGIGVIYMRFEDATPCAVQRVTTTETTAEDGGVRSTTIREVAFGDWNDRANLTYYPVNQPVPVQSNT